LLVQSANTAEQKDL